MFPFFLQWHKLGLQTDNDTAVSFWVFSPFHTVVYSEWMELHRALFVFAIFKHRIMTSNRPSFVLACLSSTSTKINGNYVLCYPGSDWVHSTWRQLPQYTWGDRSCHFNCLYLLSALDKYQKRQTWKSKIAIVALSVLVLYLSLLLLQFSHNSEFSLPHVVPHIYLSWAAAGGRPAIFGDCLQDSSLKHETMGVQIEE